MLRTRIVAAVLNTFVFLYMQDPGSKTECSNNDRRIVGGGMDDSVKCLTGGQNLALCRRFLELGALGMGDSVKFLIGGPNLALWLPGYQVTRTKCNKRHSGTDQK